MSETKRWYHRIGPGIIVAAVDPAVTALHLHSSVLHHSDVRSLTRRNNTLSVDA